MSFFDKNMGPLLEQTPGASGSGIANLIADPLNAVLGIEPGKGDVQNYVPTAELPPPAQGTQEPPPHNPISPVDATAAEQVRQTNLRKPGAGSYSPGVEAGKPNLPFRAVGEYTPPQSLEDQVFMENYQKREAAATLGVGMATLQEGMATAQAQATIRDISLNSYETLNKLVNEEFPKWRAARQEINDEIDRAARLQPNDDRYLQGLGRSGRAASAINIGLMQLSAGAGNANSVLARVDSAIARDIAEQKETREQAWKTIEQKGKNLDAQADLMEKQFLFDDKARAIAYTAAAAEVARAKQHSVNEQQYIANQMMEDRLKAMAIQAKAQYDAKLGTILLDQKVATYGQAAALIAQGKRKRAAEQQVGDLNNVQNMNPPQVQSLEGDIVGAQGLVDPNAPIAPAAPQPSAPAAQPAAARRSRRPSAGRSEGQTTSPTGAPPEAAQTPTSPEEQGAGMSLPDGSTGYAPVQNESTTETGYFQRDDGVVEEVQVPKKVGRQAGYTERREDDGGPDLSQAELEEIQSRLPEGPIRDNFGYRIAQALEVGIPLREALAEFNTIPAAIKNLRNNPADIKQASSYEDAKVIAKYNPRPSKAAYARYDGKITGKNGKAYEAAMARYEYRKRHPELFEHDHFTTQELDTGAKKGTVVVNEQNYLQGPGEMTFRLRANAKSRYDTDLRTELENSVQKAYNGVSNFLNISRVVENRGFGTVMGYNVSESGSIDFNPANVEGRADFALLQTYLTGGGIDAIKTLDPSGRLTDKDIEVGTALIAGFLEDKKWNITIDTLQTLVAAATGEHVSDNAIRKSAVKFFAVVAEGMLQKELSKISPQIVLDFAAGNLAREQVTTGRDWIDAGKAKKN